jgi:predicted transcriptional regulator YdeE
MHIMNPIESYEIEEDITLIVEKAQNFGKGIGEAFVRLAEKLENKGESRDCYGLVMKEENRMTYYAAFTELFIGEAKEKKLSTRVIEQGAYFSILINDWNQNLMHIGPTFDQLLRSELTDTAMPCIEFYRTEKELLCMVKTKLNN